MGIFNKLKNLFTDKNKDEKEQETVKKEIKLYDKGLSKTRKTFTDRLNSLSKKYKYIDDDYFDELEELLIMSDIGVNTVFNFMEKIKDRCKHENITSPDELKEVIVDSLFVIYVGNDILSSSINYNEDGPTVVLFIGVNGVGKTTTIAKIAKKEKDKGKKVLLVAGDTFRAGAREQLEEWSKRIDVGYFSNDSSDPSAVCFDAMDKAISEDYDIILIDTAGRLQNKTNLMNELEKMNKTLGQKIKNAPHETLLVVDATTGQNALSQAKSFKEITNITGIVLTKLDSSAKGGITLAIKEETGLPVKYVGLGEKAEDLVTFDIEKYIYGLFKDMIYDEKEEH